MGRFNKSEFGWEMENGQDLNYQRGLVSGVEDGGGGGGATFPGRGGRWACVDAIKRRAMPLMRRSCFTFISVSKVGRRLNEARLYFTFFAFFFLARCRDRIYAPNMVLFSTIFLRSDQPGRCLSSGKL